MWSLYIVNFVRIQHNTYYTTTTTAWSRHNPSFPHLGNPSLSHNKSLFFYWCLDFSPCCCTCKTPFKQSPLLPPWHLDQFHGRLANADVLLPLWSVYLPCTPQTHGVGVSEGTSSPPSRAMASPCSLERSLHICLNICGLHFVAICDTNSWTRMVCAPSLYLFTGW